MQRIGILTGGGDCPGLNAVIRGVVAGRRPASRRGGGRDSRRLGRTDGGASAPARPRCGARDPAAGRHDSRHISARSVRPRRGRRVAAGNAHARVDRLTRRGRRRRHAPHRARLSEEGLRLVGVPKTIDNDIAGTDVTFGFDTAVQIATEAIDRITTTAESHNRVMVVEVMGRTQRLDRDLRGHRGRRGRDPRPRGAVRPRRGRGSCCAPAPRAGGSYSVVVVAEGIAPPEGAQVVGAARRRSGSSGSAASRRSWRRGSRSCTGFETRVTVLGHIQRGGTPSAADRVLGVAARRRGGRPRRRRAVSGGWSRCAARRSSTSRSRRRAARCAACLPTSLDVAHTLSAP